MSDTSTISLTVESGVATLTLNRPDAMNAFNAAMSRELIEAFDEIDGNDAIRAVVVTGAGRAFSAGADLSEGTAAFEAGTSDGLPRKDDGSIDYTDASIRDPGGLMTLRIFETLKPVIGAINGVSIGIGATVTLPMDIRLASTKARFGFVFTRRGIVPEGASAFFLPRISGISKALEWCCSGRIFDAEEALSGGLVSEVLEPDALMDRARELAAEIADNAAPVSVALTRQMMWRGLGFQHPMEAHRVDSRGVVARGRSADAKEGVMSFLEKRPAEFPDTVSGDMPDFFPWWDEPEYR